MLKFRTMFELHRNQDPDRWLRFVTGSAVCRWTSPDGKQRVYLVARNDGMFSSASEYFSGAEFEHCWASNGITGGIYDSENTAIREIQAAFPWSREVERENSKINSLLD